MATMAAAAGFEWSRSVRRASGDSVPSPIYPDRPIRPLPTRRLRSRLSEEQAGSIVFPPVPPSSSPVFDQAYATAERSFHPAITTDDYLDATQTDLDEVEHDEHCGCGHHSDLDTDDEVRDYSDNNHSQSGRMLRYPSQYVQLKKTERHNPPPPRSNASSGDGYESFENTNNKKKRKIPISGSALPLGVSTSSHSVDVSHSSDNHSITGQYHVPSTGVGISGAGRGRFARPTTRSLHDRRPLAGNGPLAAYNNSVLAAKAKHAGQALGSSTSNDNAGIISTAIANAANKGSAAPLKGQENISLLQRQQRGQGKENDFTFECKSDSSNNMALRPNEHTQSMKQMPVNNVRGSATHGTQTPLQTNVAHRPPLAETGSHASNQQAAQEKKTKPRRPPGQIYERAARLRKKNQATENYYHPPKSEDQWMCEFCEYEAIFGEPPSALIRQYEIKDLKDRKKREQNRRALEKAKAKNNNRKNRKSGKANAKSTAAAPTNSQHADAHPYDSHDAHYDNVPPPDVDSQGEEFFDDGYDDAGHSTSPYPEDGVNGHADGYLPPHNNDAHGPPPPPR